jgi:hypothetical protein
MQLVHARPRAVADPLEADAPPGADLRLVSVPPDPPHADDGGEPPGGGGVSRPRALYELHRLRPVLTLTSRAVHPAVRGSDPRGRETARAALAVLGPHAVLLAEAQAFCTRTADPAAPSGGASVWDFFDLWAEPAEHAPEPWNVRRGSANRRVYDTAFHAAWLFCVAMQGRGAFPPGAYLRALGLVIPPGADSLADLAGLPSVADVERALNAGWSDVYAGGLARGLWNAFDRLGTADAHASLLRARETPDAHGATG